VNPGLVGIPSGCSLLYSHFPSLLSIRPSCITPAYYFAYKQFVLVALLSTVIAPLSSALLRIIGSDCVSHIACHLLHQDKNTRRHKVHIHAEVFRDSCTSRHSLCIFGLRLSSSLLQSFVVFVAEFRHCIKSTGYDGSADSNSAAPSPVKRLFHLCLS